MNWTLQDIQRKGLKIAGIDKPKETAKFIQSISLPIKPMSVNEAWQGKRFKTKKYLAYQQEVLLRLPKLTMPPPPYRFFYEFGFSNVLSDWDNPCKILQDILQKKYNFNDKDIHEAHVKKVMVKKGCEYFTVSFESIKKY